MSVHYDPLLAKLIAFAETREAARRRALAALRRYAVLGIRTNIPFLVRVLEHEAFRDATIDTGFLDGPGAGLAAGIAPDPGRLRAAAAAVAAHVPRRTARAVEAAGTAYDPWTSLGDWGRGPAGGGR